MERALAGDGEVDVPCDGCTACCRSSQFVAVEPDETETLAHIPPELLFPAPRRPPGHVLLGYDQNGHCPMLVDDRCSIYEQRPRTCRTYDCRVLAAAGVEVDDLRQQPVAQRVRRWRFALPTEADRAAQEAVQAAARFVGEHGDRLPVGAAPAGATRRSVMAVELHEVFLRPADATGPPVDPGPEQIRAVLEKKRVRGDRPEGG